MRTFSSKEIREFLWKFLLTLFLYLSYFTEIKSYFQANFGQYVTGFIDGVVVSISCFVLVLYLTEEKKDKEDGKAEVEYIEGISAYLFFPPGVPREQQDLNYHKKHLHHRLIVNHNTRPPVAYYLTPDSYSWKFIEAYPQTWLSEVVKTENYSVDDPDFIKKWCDSKGYRLVPRSASKKDLLESG